MTELNELLNFRRYYVYSQATERITVAKGKLHDMAKEKYSQLLAGMDNDSFEVWALQIALDCVRQFTVDELQHIADNRDIYDFHFGYGMYVRNHYIHRSMRHRWCMPDMISEMVKEYILGIVCTDYIPFDTAKEC